MHEMGVANSVLDAVRAEALRFEKGHIHKVVVRIGELAGVDPDAVRFCFDVLVRGSELEPLALEIEYRKRQQRCRGCGRSYAASSEDVPCPVCGLASSTFSGGDELEIVYLEVEDGASAA